MFVAVVHVVGQGAQVVEELGVDGPAAVGLPESVADEVAFELVDGVAEENSFQAAAVFEGDEGEAFVGAGERAVVGRGGGGEPAFVDAAAIAAQGVVVVGVEFDAPAGDAEGARDPGGGEAEDAAALFEGAGGEGGGGGFFDGGFAGCGFGGHVILRRSGMLRGG